MEIFSRYNVCSTLLTLSHRREQRKQRRASIDTEVGTNYAFKHYPAVIWVIPKLIIFYLLLTCAAFAPVYIMVYITYFQFVKNMLPLMT